jgi:hypothetical protein
MILKTIAIHVLGTALMTSGMGVMGFAQKAQTPGTVPTSSATQVSAEMTKGRLNPNESKPGDRVAMKLREDVRSNGRVVLKKGTTIEGVVKNVMRVEGQDAARGRAQALIEIEWLKPGIARKSTQQLSIALQSIAQVSTVEPRHPDGGVETTKTVHAGVPVGGSPGSSAGAAGGVAQRTPASVSGTSNVALMSMPNVIAADSQTASLLESTFGLSSSAQLYKVGRGEVVSASGTKHSMDIFSHMSNDTVITSSSTSFEISSGAELQVLVGVKG